MREQSKCRAEIKKDETAEKNCVAVFVLKL